MLRLWYLDLRNEGDNEAKPCTNPRNEIPSDVDPRTNASPTFCYEIGSSQSTIRTRDSRIVFYYEIHSLAPNLPDTGYYVDGYAKVPGIGANEASCTIRKKANNAIANDSPYTCSVTWADHNPHSIDPQPHWTVEPKPTNVVDAKTASSAQVQAAVKAVVDSCGQGHPNCTYDATSQKVVQVPEGPNWEVLTNPYANHTDSDAPYEFDQGWKLSWKNSFKFKAEADIAKFPIDIITTKISAEYEHDWTQEFESHTKYSMKIKPGKVGIFYLQPGYLEVTGNFRIVYADRIDVLRNLEVDFPLSERPVPIDAKTYAYNGIVWGCNLPGNQKNLPRPGIVQGGPSGKGTLCPDPAKPEVVK